MSLANEAQSAAYSNVPVEELTAFPEVAQSVLAECQAEPCELPHSAHLVSANSYTLVATTSFDSFDAGAVTDQPLQVSKQLLQPRASMTAQGDLPNRDWNAEHQSLLEWFVSRVWPMRRDSLLLSAVPIKLCGTSVPVCKTKLACSNCAV